MSEERTPKNVVKEQILEAANYLKLAWDWAAKQVAAYPQISLAIIIYLLVR